MQLFCWHLWTVWVISHNLCAWCVYLLPGSFIFDSAHVAHSVWFPHGVSGSSSSRHEVQLLVQVFSAAVTWWQTTTRRDCPVLSELFVGNLSMHSFFQDDNKRDFYSVHILMTSKINYWSRCICLISFFDYTIFS